MRNDLPIKEIQDEILNVALYFDQLCIENNIEYFLMGGTALGAIRHNGFIPWDDDFDVFLKVDEYYKLKEVLRNQNGKNLCYFQEERSLEWPLYFSKFRSQHAEYYEEGDQEREMHHGVYIDIMKLCNGYDWIFLRYIQYVLARLLSARALYSHGYKTRNALKKLTMIVASFFISDYIEKIIVKFVDNTKGKNSEYLVHFFGRAPFARSCYRRNYFSSSKRVVFSGCKFPVCNDVLEYLHTRFGSKCMEIPSEVERSKYPSHCVLFKRKLNNR